MGQVIHLHGDPHHETQMLLPWYVTGQLETSDLKLVEAHLPGCAECREDLAVERQLIVAVREAPGAADEQWERMAAQLPAQVDDRVWWRRPIRVAWFIGAQAAVVVLCVGLVASQRIGPPAPAYHALGDAPASATGNMLVMFAPGVSPGAARAAIMGAHARLVSGPTDAGAYIVWAPAGNRDGALATLRARRDVTLAQPVDAPSP